MTGIALPVLCRLHGGDLDVELLWGGHGHRRGGGCGSKGWDWSRRVGGERGRRCERGPQAVGLIRTTEAGVLLPRVLVISPPIQPVRMGARYRETAVAPVGARRRADLLEARVGAAPRSPVLPRPARFVGDGHVVGALAGGWPGLAIAAAVVVVAGAVVAGGTVTGMAGLGVRYPAAEVAALAPNMVSILAYTAPIGITFLCQTQAPED